LKLKVSEVARELGLKSKEVVDIAKEIGVNASIRGGITPQDAMKIEEYLKNKSAKPEKKVEKVVKKEPPKEEEKPKRRRRSFDELKKSLKKKPEVVKKVEEEKPKPKPKPVEEPKKEKKEEPKKPAPKKAKKPAPKKHVEEKELEINVDLAEMDVIEENQVELLDLYFNDISLKDDEKLEEKAKTKTQIENQKEAKKQQQLKRQKAAAKTGGITKTSAKKKKKKKKKEAGVEVVKIPKEVRVHEFADAIKKPLEEVLEALRELGEERDKNDFLGEEYIETLAEEFDVPDLRPTCGI